MSINKRTILIICGSLLVLLIAVNVIGDVVYREGFENLEKETVTKNVNQVTDALSASLDALDTYCYDWAEWDDTYQFAQEYNQDYVDRNLRGDTFTSTDISLVSVFNTSQETVYGKTYDLINSKEITLPVDFANIVIATGLATPANTGNATRGIILLTGQPMLVVSRPVLTSLGEGPITGALIFGRFVDADVVSHLSETTHSSVSLLPIPSDNANPETNRLIASLDKSGPMYIQAQSSQIIAGYTYVNDLAGYPAFIFKVVVPRDIYQEGLKAITVLHSVLLFIGITFGIVFIILIRKLVLSRLVKLSNSVSKIGSGGDVSGRVNVPGNDELSRLGDNINEMLASVENANKAMKEADELLKENNKQLDTVLNSVPCGIIVVDEETYTIHDVNFYASTLIGAPMEEIIGQECHRFLCPTKLGKCPVTHSGESDDNAEEIIVNSSANAIPILKNVARVTMGGSRYLLETFIDITEQKQMEKSLKDSEERFSKAFRASPDAISISRVSDGAFLEINDSYTRIIGYSREELLGKDADNFNLWAKADQREAMLQKIRNHILMHNDELEMRSKSGEIRTLLLSTEYVQIDNEPCLLVVGTDITERKKLEETLAIEAARRRILIEQSSDGIVILDQNGAVYEANRRFAEMLGYSPEEILKLNVWDWEFLYPPEQVKEMIRTIDEAGDHFETRHRRKDGTIYDVEISTNGAMFGGQKLIFCVCRDISERKRMEKALKESEEKFSIAFRASPNTMVITTEKDGKFIEINDSHTRLTGYTREETIGRTAVELGLWSKEENRARMLNILKTKGRVDNEEFVFRMKSGELRDWLFSAEHIVIGGEPCLISMTTDITEQKRMQQALRESEEKFSIAFHSSPVVIAITTLKDGRYLEVNGSYVQATGYTPEELIGRTATEVNMWVRPKDRARLFRILKEQGRVSNEEFDFRMKSGEVRTWLFSAERIKIAGEPCLIGVSVDITERKRAEEALREREKRFSDIADNAREWIWEVNAKGKYTYSSPVIEKILGYNPEEILEKHFYDFFLPEEREELKKAAFEAFVQKQPIKEFINKNRHKNGKTVVLLTSGVPVIDELGNLLGYRGVDTDITERQRAEQALKESMANLERSSNQLKATNKEMEAFSYSVSHDLRSPLRSIDGFSQALMEDYREKLDEKGRDYLGRLRGASQKMGELIDAILKLSRLTRSEMRHVPIDLSALASEIAGQLQETQPERKVKFAIDKELTASGDPQLLRVLLENLLGNAWKFTGKQPKARIEFSMEQNNGKKAYFIRDNGAGFDMTYADKLFGAFQRLHDAAEFPGTGIGLATVQRIIHRHGGSIWAEGSVGKGATFHFTLD